MDDKIISYINAEISSLHDTDCGKEAMRRIVRIQGMLDLTRHVSSSINLEGLYSDFGAARTSAEHKINVTDNSNL